MGLFGAGHGDTYPKIMKLGTTWPLPKKRPKKYINHVTPEISKFGYIKKY